MHHGPGDVFCSLVKFVRTCWTLQDKTEAVMLSVVGWKYGLCLFFCLQLQHLSCEEETVSLYMLLKLLWTKLPVLWLCVSRSEALATASGFTFVFLLTTKALKYALKKKFPKSSLLDVRDIGTFQCACMRVCVCVWVHLPQHICGYERTTSESQVTPSSKWFLASISSACQGPLLLSHLCCPESVN